jgi:hypothetical protein
MAARTKRINGWWGLAGAALAAACGGSSVDLGQRDKTGFSDLPDLPAVSAEGEPVPQTIYEGETRVIAYTVDETTLYALLDSPDDNGQLVSCPIERCRSERQTLVRGVGSFVTQSSSTPLELVSGTLFWIYGVGFPGSGIASCPVSGCESPTRAESPALECDIAADAEHVYWIDAEGWLSRWATDGSPAERLRDVNGAPGMDGPTIGRVKRIAVAGDYVYFLQDGLPPNSVLSRARKDGSEEPELLVTAPHASSVGATLNDAYYTSHTLAGSLRAYPASGAGGERVVASNQRWPLALQIEGDEAFWMNKQRPTTRSAQGTLVSCKLPDCAATKTWVSQVDLLNAALGLDTFDVSQCLGLNSRWLFWNERGGSLGSALRRLPR